MRWMSISLSQQLLRLISFVHQLLLRRLWVVIIIIINMVINNTIINGTLVKLWNIMGETSIIGETTRNGFNNSIVDKFVICMFSKSLVEALDLTCELYVCRWSK